uniref:SFRICE_001544 n=1 Tax=Spodoptera frugiperda TaxID=7108 RepID=A0A2H1W5P2_SPOFR
MAALKTTLVLLLIAFAMLASVGAVRVGPCDQVCSRIDAEKDECCRAHGYSGYNSCREQFFVIRNSKSKSKFQLIHVETNFNEVRRYCPSVLFVNEGEAHDAKEDTSV